MIFLKGGNRQNFWQIGFPALQRVYKVRNNIQQEEYIYLQKATTVAREKNVLLKLGEVDSIRSVGK